MIVWEKFKLIHIIHTLGGCGGTILSRCIGVLPGVALLSEINPASVKLFEQFDPLYQDRNWLNLLNADDAERFSKMDLTSVESFRELIATFHLGADRTGRHLVLRDYNFVDFVGVPFIPEPPRKLQLYDALPPGVPTRSTALIRHPIDQWRSLCKHKIVSDILTPAVFCDAYAGFLDALRMIPVHQYEDFVAQPEDVLMSMCEDLSLLFDPAFHDRFHSFDYVTGDFTRHRENSISRPPRLRVPACVLDQFRSSASFRQILDATGYSEVPAS